MEKNYLFNLCVNLCVTLCFKLHGATQSKRGGSWRGYEMVNRVSNPRGGNPSDYCNLFAFNNLRNETVLINSNYYDNLLVIK